MKTLINPSEEQLADLLVRPGIKTDDLEKIGRDIFTEVGKTCLLYTSPSPRDA